MTIYHLAAHVHTCLANGHVIFLDIKNDRYSALPRGVSKRLSSLVTRRAISADEFVDACPEIREALSSLIGRGLLQTDAPGPEKVQPRTVNKPCRDLSEANIEGRRRIRFSHMANFLYAYCRALLGTKILGIDWLIRDLSHPRSGKAPPGDNGHRLEELMESFRFIRIFFYKETDRCYFDCAVHMYFLRRYSFEPAWVFGVQMEPFHAHCWVQVEDVAITSHLPETGMLRPILVV